MITKDISESKGYAKLSPKAAVLFTMMIPHLNSHGKMNGGPGYLKEIVCPLVPYLTLRTIPKLLQEIHHNTNVKWFCHQDRMWIQSLRFLEEHQELDPLKLGADLLPTYSGVTPELVHHEVEGEEEVEDKVEEEGAEASSPPQPVLEFPTARKGTFYALTKGKLEEYQATYPYLDVPKILMFARQWCIDNPTRRKTPGGMPSFLGRWLTKEADRPKGVGYAGSSGRSKIAGTAAPEPGKYEGLE